MVDRLASLSRFGVYPHYLRPSAVHKLLQCPGSRAMLMEMLDDDEGGAAAQLGSLVHKACQGFHEADMTGSNPEHMRKGGLLALDASKQLFPLADPEEAKKIFACYSFDSRNWRKVVATEKQVEFYLPPHRLDPTKQPIYIKGTCDQIGPNADGEMSLWDIKTGSRLDGLQMIHEHAVQLACYYLGAIAAGYQVKNAYILRTHAYRVRGAVLPSPDRYEWYCPVAHFSGRVARTLLDRVALEVALIRMGEVNISTGVQCVWCEHGGLLNCEPKLQEFLGILT